ncbi:MAG: hypothetical protein ACTSP9_03085 [Promethearchaeota archaeon]
MPDGSDEFQDAGIHEPTNKRTAFVQDEEYWKMKEKLKEKKNKVTQEEEYKMRIQCPYCEKFIWVYLKKEVREN